MKRLSIKAKVTLWYTMLVVFMLLAVLLYLLSFSSQIFNRQMSDNLIDVVADAVKDTHFEHGQLEDEEIDFYRDGVSVFLYDVNGRLLAPKTNRGIQVDAILQDQLVKKVSSMGEDWLVYDLYAVSDGTAYWVRGVILLSSVTKTLQAMGVLAFIAAPLFILLAAAGGWLITKRAFTPVGEMASIADAITTGQDLSLRLKENDADDEINHLCRTINFMLKRLQDSFENERQFTSDASHELRTPIAVIISQCEYALASETTDQERKAALESMLSQARRLSGMLSQLLLLSRADNGKFQPVWETVDMTMLCEMVVDEAALAAKERSVILSTQLDENVLLMGDETLLIRLVMNLVNNAIRYNKPQGMVMVRLYEEADGVMLIIKDTGIGIKSENLDNIWRRFYRIDESRSSEGTGLGLAMVKWICDVHHGQVAVESEVQKGSTFRVYLPKTQ